MDEDDDLGARLRGVVALAERHDTAPPEDLFDGIVRSGTTARRRRAAGAGAVGVAVAAGVALLVPHLAPRDAALVPAVPSPSPSSTSHYTWTDWPTPTPPPPTNAVAIPDVMPREPELGGMRWSPDGVVESPTGPAAYGVQTCDPLSLGEESTPAPDVVRQVAGATLSAWTPDGTTSASITVTVWPDGRGWQQVLEDSGTCRLLHHRMLEPAGADPPDTVRLVGDLGHQRAVVRRVHQVIVAVDVAAPDDATAQREAERISDLVVAAVTAQDGPWAQGRRG